MRYQGIIKLPEDTDVLEQDANEDYVVGNLVVYWLSLIRTEWMNHPAPLGGSMSPGTHPEGGEKILHFFGVSVPSEDPVGFLEALLTTHGLDDWSIEAFYPLYGQDMTVIELDEFGEPTGEMVPFEVDIPVPNSLEPFLNDIDDIGTRPTLPAALHTVSDVTMVVPAA